MHWLIRLSWTVDPSHKSHNAPFCNRNMHIFVTKWCIVGWDWCIVGFVQQFYWMPSQNKKCVQEMLECQSIFASCTLTSKANKLILCRWLNINPFNSMIWFYPNGCGEILGTIIKLSLKRSLHRSCVYSCLVAMVPWVVLFSSQHHQWLYALDPFHENSS